MKNQDKKAVLIRNGFNISTGLHGQIFVTPFNKGNMFMRSFDNINQAYNHYYSYLTL